MPEVATEWQQHFANNRYSGIAVPDPEMVRAGALCSCAGTNVLGFVRGVVSEPFSDLGKVFDVLPAAKKVEYPIMLHVKKPSCVYS